MLWFRTEILRFFIILLALYAEKRYNYDLIRAAASCGERF